MSTENPYPPQGVIVFEVKEMLQEIKHDIKEINQRVGVLEKESYRREGSTDKGDRTSRFIFALIGGSSAIAAIVVGVLNLIF